MRIKAKEIYNQKASDEMRAYLHTELVRIIENYEDIKERKIWASGIPKGAIKAYEETARIRKITRKSIKKIRKSLPCLENMAELTVRGKTLTLEGYNN